MARILKFEKVSHHCTTELFVMIKTTYNFKFWIATILCPDNASMKPCFVMLHLMPINTQRNWTWSERPTNTLRSWGSFWYLEFGCGNNVNRSLKCVGKVDFDQFVVPKIIKVGPHFLKSLLFRLTSSNPWNWVSEPLNNNKLGPDQKWGFKKCDGKNWAKNSTSERNWLSR
jgi:hypothetical protein